MSRTGGRRSHPDSPHPVSRRILVPNLQMDTPLYNKGFTPLIYSESFTFCSGPFDRSLSEQSPFSPTHNSSLIDREYYETLKHPE